MGATKKTTATPEVVSVPAIEIRPMEIVLIGDSPLISHRWSEKAKEMMLDKQMKKATKGKEAKDPERDYRESLYDFPSEHGEYGFPAVAFKSAAVGACRFLDMKMTEARGAFHVLGELVPIEGKPKMREDMVRVGMGTADIRYRGEFPEWKAYLALRFNATVFSPGQIVNLFNNAGFGVGVGEWRPEKNGSFGMFHVATESER